MKFQYSFQGQNKAKRTIAVLLLADYVWLLSDTPSSGQTGTKTLKKLFSFFNV